MTKSKYFAPVGRILRYQENPNASVSPASCTITGFPKLKGKGLTQWERLNDFSQYVALSIKYGAGVNVHLNSYSKDDCVALFHSYVGHNPDNLPKIYPYLSTEHTDFLKHGFELYDTPSPGAEVLEVPDSIKGISEAIVTAMFSLSRGKSLIIDLSQLQEEDHTFADGTVASGPYSFWQMFKAAYRFWANPILTNLLSWISENNAQIRKGGLHKNGAVTTSLCVAHPDLEEYLTASPVSFPWLKRGLTLLKDASAVVKDWPDVFNAVLGLVNEGSLWLEKAMLNTSGVHTFATWAEWAYWNKFDPSRILKHNVCREVLIDLSETCTLSPVNLGQVQHPDEIPSAMVECMDLLTEIHAINGPWLASDGMFAHADIDKQVGLGFIGLANMLAHLGVSYRQLLAAFDELNYVSFILTGEQPSDSEVLEKDLPRLVAFKFAQGFRLSGGLAESKGFKRAFAIAPTATSSFRYKDYKGYTTTPNIQPAIGRTVERVSDTFKMDQIFTYPPTAELLEDVGYEVYYRIACHFQNMMEATKLAHAISFDLIEDMTPARFDEWFKGPLTSTYYRLMTGSAHLDKTDQLSGCSACAN